MRYKMGYYQKHMLHGFVVWMFGALEASIKCADG